MVLYIFRAAFYEIPYYGGRAQGKRRPRAPTLKERPNGRKRAFSIGGASGVDTYEDGEGEERQRVKRRSIDHGSGDEDGDIGEEG